MFQTFNMLTFVCLEPGIYKGLDLLAAARISPPLLKSKMTKVHRPPKTPIESSCPSVSLVGIFLTLREVEEGQQHMGR